MRQDPTQEVIDERRIIVPWWVDSAIEDRTPLRTFWVVGGLGAGKSHGGQAWDIARVLENGVSINEPKPSKSWTVAPNYRISDTLFDLTLHVAMESFGMRESTHFLIKRAFPRYLDFTPMGLNHRMMFLTADRPEMFVSESITHWRWSEVAVSKPEVLQKLHDRLRDKRAKVLQGLGDSTPEGVSNHFYDLAGFGGAESDVVDEERNYRKFRVETTDNAANLADGYVNALRARYAYSSDHLKAYELGLFTNLRSSGSAWSQFIESRNVVSPIEPNPNLPLLFCWDFNASPLAWVVAQRFWEQRNYYSPRVEKIIGLKESSGESRGLLDAVAEFSAKFPVHKFGNTPIEIYGDATGWAKSHKGNTASDYMNIEDYLRALGYRRVEVYAMRSNPHVRQRLEKCAALMAYEMFAVTSECKRTISGFTKTMLKPGTWDIEKPQGEDWSHWPDAISYGLFKMFKDTDVVNPNAKGARGVAL
jgi:hypothetical protein